MISVQQMVFRLLILCLCIPWISHAQNRTGGRFNDASPAATYQQLQQRFSAVTNTISGMIAMEGALDADAYLVGPGDQFSLSIGGAIPFQTHMPVSAEGNLLMFDAGSISVAGKTLREVREMALEALTQQYQHVPVDVNLVLPRRFYVHLAGAVPEPGRYLMLPLARLDDAIQQGFASQATARPDPTAGNQVRIVGSATAEVPTLQPGFKPSLRNIRVTRQNGSVHSYDLFRYYVLGDLGNNPYLYDGDVIHLTTYQENRSAIVVTGDVATPGQMEFRAGDTVLDVLRIAANNVDVSHFERVRLTRRANVGASTTIDLDISSMLAGTIEPPLLMAGDHLNVENAERPKAAVYGLVEFPGSFPIENGQTTLRELLVMAGGLKPDANPAAAYLERRQSQASRPNADVSDLDFFERAYLQRSVSRNRVAVNIADALEPDAADIVLYGGDVLYFPRDEQTVHVAGNAVKPGYVPYVPGKTVSYYVDAAGGEGPLSTGIYVFDAGSGEIHTNGSAVVNPGDTVFINRESIADSPELQSLLITDQVSRRQARIATTQTIITGITALVSVINTYLLIRDRLGN